MQKKKSLNPNTLIKSKLGDQKLLNLPESVTKKLKQCDKPNLIVTSFRLTHILSLPGNFHPSRSAISAQRSRRGRRGWWWLAKRRAGSGWATFAPGREWTSPRARATKTWAASSPLQPPLPLGGRNPLGRNLRGRSKGPGKKGYHRRHTQFKSCICVISFLNSHLPAAG